MHVHRIPPGQLCDEWGMSGGTGILVSGWFETRRQYQFFNSVFVEVIRYGNKEEIFVFVGVAVLFGNLGVDGSGDDVWWDRDVVLGIVVVIVFVGIHVVSVEAFTILIIVVSITTMVIVVRLIGGRIVIKCNVVKGWIVHWHGRH